MLFGIIIAMINSISFHSNQPFQSTSQTVQFYIHSNKLTPEKLKFTKQFQQFCKFQEHFKTIKKLDKLKFSEALKQQQAMLNVLKDNVNFDQQKVQHIQQKIQDLKTSPQQIPTQDYNNFRQQIIQINKDINLLIKPEPPIVALWNNL